MIEASGVTKRFGRLEVLRGIDLSIPSGRITGLVGPNAAGKTTLIK
ncbi:MAG: ATP-binding cassette domain-containing protein, partial [Gemmatimonadales bacterium]